MTAELTVTLTLLSDDYGDWCDDCLLPAVTRYAYVVESAGSLTAGELRKCLRCAGDE